MASFCISISNYESSSCSTSSPALCIVRVFSLSLSLSSLPALSWKQASHETAYTKSLLWKGWGSVEPHVGHRLGKRMAVHRLRNSRAICTASAKKKKSQDSWVIKLESVQVWNSHNIWHEGYCLIHLTPCSILNIHLNKCLHFVLWAFIYFSEYMGSPTYKDHVNRQLQLQGRSKDLGHTLLCSWSQGREVQNIQQIPKWWLHTFGKS